MINLFANKRRYGHNNNSTSIIEIQVSCFKVLFFCWFALCVFICHTFRLRTLIKILTMYVWRCTCCDDTPVVVVCVHSHKYWLLITSRLIGWLAGWWVWQAKHWRNSWFGSVVISQSLRDAKPLWAIVCGGGVYFHAITNNKSFLLYSFQAMWMNMDSNVRKISITNHMNSLCQTIWKHWPRGERNGKQFWRKIQISLM